MSTLYLVLSSVIHGSDFYMLVGLRERWVYMRPNRPTKRDCIVKISLYIYRITHRQSGTESVCIEMNLLVDRKYSEYLFYYSKGSLKEELRNFDPASPHFVRLPLFSRVFFASLLLALNPLYQFDKYQNVNWQNDLPRRRFLLLQGRQAWGAGAHLHRQGLWGLHLLPRE